MQFPPCRLAVMLLTVALSVLSLNGFSQRVSAGTFHSLFVCDDGTVWACGDNSQGQLGNGTTVSSIIPKQVDGLSNVIAVSAGEAFSLALTANGEVWAWGSDSVGQLEDSLPLASSTRPVRVHNLSNVVAISTIHRHSLALKSDGTVWAWGKNAKGELGDGSTTLRSSPVPIQAQQASFKAIATGVGFSVALSADSIVWTWGNGGNGQLGTGSISIIPDPSPDPIGLDSIVQIAAGGIHALALQSNDTLWAWGRGTEGQLGDGASTQRNVPTKAQPIAFGIDSIAAGGFHSFAILSNGNVFGWGSNANGELGNAGTSNVTTPTQIPNLSNIKTLSGGYSHSIGLHIGDTVSVWGGNGAGQLGDNSLTRKLSPVRLFGLCPPYVDHRDLVFTNYFRPSVSSPGQWMAGELASSIALPDGKRMYLFGQSHIGTIINGSVPCDSSLGVRNCIVLQDSAAPGSLSTLLDPNGSPQDRSYFRDSSGMGSHYEPGHGYLRDDSTALVFLSRWSDNRTLIGNYHGRLRKGITTWTLEDINRIMPNNTDIDFGTAAIVEGNYVYAYGSKMQSGIRLPYIARSLFADTSAPWEYYDTLNATWTTSLSAAKPISLYNVAEHFSVTEIQNRYYLISHDQAPDTSTCNDPRNIIVYRSTSLTGQFSEPTLLYVTPDSLGSRYMLTFNAVAHQGLANCDSLLISYNVFDADHADCPSQCDSASFQKADSWRPKFIRVPFDSIDSQLPPTPSPIASFTIDSISGGTVWFANGSSNGVFFQWYFGDGDSSHSFNPIHVYTYTDTFQVTLIVTGCYGDRDTFQSTTVTVVSQVPPMPKPAPKVTIFPNPSSGDITIRADAAGNQPILVEVFTTLGIRQYVGKHSPVTSKLDLHLDNGNLGIFPCPGLYHIRLSNGSFSATRAVSVLPME